MALTRRKFLKGLLGMVLAGLFVSIYAVLIEPSLRLRVKRWNVRSKHWTGAPLRIALISDLHMCEPFQPLARLERVVRRVNGLGADMIVYLGDLNASHDFVQGHVPISDSAKRLRALEAPLGVHTILGNHDWWDDLAAQERQDGPSETARILRKAGLPVLQNTAIKITREGGDFWLAGLDSQNAFKKWNQVRGGAHDMQATLAAITDDAPAILLAHEPDVFADMPERFALTLSGHTHGGQIRIFGWSPRVPSKFGDRFVYGHVRENERDLVVSGGIGCSTIPVRLGVTPEITVVELSA